MSIKQEAILRALAALVFIKWTGFADISWFIVMTPVWIIPAISILSGLRSLAVHMLREAL